MKKSLFCGSIEDIRGNQVNWLVGITLRTDFTLECIGWVLLRFNNTTVKGVRWHLWLESYICIKFIQAQCVLTCLLIQCMLSIVFFQFSFWYFHNYIKDTVQNRLLVACVCSIWAGGARSDYHRTDRLGEYVLELIDMKYRVQLFLFWAEYWKKSQRSETAGIWFVE